ncbi:hypothetical protein GALMADRAFT_141499 [Galerina marginata CBS 339.88]|uniref:Protein kinase domain-containing protein n=1 Tax=Galerina marginata (strain CBS 339.88) TaxID=685588 RepID=A0A067T3I9_GALM3|nr:hypothetical protein GALMADRAFT_141499 [Galerina marginata CBS 339.88]
MLCSTTLRLLRFRSPRGPSSSTAFFRNLKTFADAGISGGPTNQHISIDADGKVCVDLTFVQEPLGLSASDGYGWPQFEFGEAIGPDKRYIIIRKLGARALGWPAIKNEFVAVKGLTGYTTGLIHRGLVWEPEALRLLSRSSNTSPYCLKLLSSFTIPGKGSAGEHLCLVTQLLGGDVRSLHEWQNGKVFPLRLAKRILLHVLRGIAHAHRCGVVHTDLKHDNIFFDTGMSTTEFGKLLASDPACRHPPEVSQDGIVQAAVSQPLPVPTLAEAMKRTYVVADFGSAQPITNHQIDEITAFPLRPPENFIGGPWNEKVDIWTFGCLIFELVTSRGLFKYEPGPKLKLDETENILFQMICYTGEDFSEERLSAGRLAGKYFDSTCNLRADPDLINYPFELSIRVYNVIQESDILSTAALMRQCLRLDPADRASAEELLADPWFAGVD